MKNIDKMTKKELAHQIFMSKVRSGKQNLMDKHTKGKRRQNQQQKE